VILVPSLLAFWAVVTWTSRRRLALPRLLLDAACMAAGAVCLLGLFAGYHRIAAGDWHYFRATLEYASKYNLQEAAKWLRPLSLWQLAFDCWLAVPLTVCAGSAVALVVRAGRRQLFEQPAALYWVVNAVGVLLLLVVLRETRGMPMLDTSAYPYLLAPMWFLALGPLMAPACTGRSARGFAALAAGCLVLGALPVARQVVPYLAPFSGLRWVMPVLWTIGLAGCTWLALRPRGGPALAGFLATLWCVSTFGAAPVLALRWHLDSSGRRGYLGVDRGVALLDRSLARRPYWLWLSPDDPHYTYLRGVFSAKLAFVHWWPNEKAPEVQPAEANGISPGSLLVILSSVGQEVTSRSVAALAGAGVDCKVVGREVVPVGDWAYALTYLQAGGRRLEAERSMAQVPPEQLLVVDPAASGGQYRFTPRGRPNTVLAFGPYFTLPAGHYEVRFALRTDDCTVREPIARCDAVTRGGERVFAVLVPRGTDFRAPNTFQTFSAAFDLPQPMPFAEFRVFATGKAGVGLDYIDVDVVPLPDADGVHPGGER
jgi:hypothetical protein